ncbi:unnamed protein product [Clavelina lepadiformis]|uniref:Uncharacterized protein n=1 Tax=Clavelina lepadiformis TaxID=159417 RepID=A0ABP0GXH7_CLALP
MGSKLSSLSCTSCGPQSHYSGRRNVRRRSRRRSSSRYRYQESFYDTILPAEVFMTRINTVPTQVLASNKHSPKQCNSSKDGKQDSENCHAPRDGKGVRKAFQGDCNPATMPHDEQSKKMGNSIEILDCPDMSTISISGGSSHVISIFAASGNATPIDKRIDDVVFESQRYNGDVTATTLNVPPNSLNSQFISGITPLESIAEDGDHDISSDSVFVHDPHSDYNYYPGDSRFRHRQAYSEYNNSLLQVPDYHVIERTTQTNASSLQVEGSNGPGFDSDFGASAGVEMRIVSSDYSSINISTFRKLKWSAIKRWIPPKNEKGGKIFRKCLLNGDTTALIRRPSVRSLSQPFVLAPVALSSRQARLASKRRHATVAGPECPSLHVTMEWDPYDMNYGATHWMEYIIPGITYPSHPLLCNEQYWV